MVTLTQPADQRFPLTKWELLPLFSELYLKARLGPMFSALKLYITPTSISHSPCGPGPQNYPRELGLQAGSLENQAFKGWGVGPLAFE